MASKTYPDVYLEKLEAAEDTGWEPNQVWHRAILGAKVWE